VRTAPSAAVRAYRAEMPSDHRHPHQDGDGPRHGHADGHGVAARRAGARYRRPLFVSFLLIVAFLVVQVVVGILTDSLALLSDAGHMASDALGLGMALAAIQAASKARAHPQRTYGLYRLEILAALGNAVLLFGVAGYVLFEAARRIGDAPEVESWPVLIIGVLGLVVNAVSFVLLRVGAKESLNLEGAYVEVLADTLGSVAVIIGAALWGVTGWTWVDPLLGAAIGAFILPRAFRLGREALRVLVQAAPAGVDVSAVQYDLASIAGVVDVHDVHVWTLTSDMEVASAHVMVRVGADAHRVLDEARVLLRDRHGLDHATLQVEPDDHRGCDEVSW
jgi:cobalt-zinc-cadmium efflux system protein